MENESAQTMKLFISTSVNLFEDVCLLRKSAVREKVSTQGEKGKPILLI